MPPEQREGRQPYDIPATTSLVDADVELSVIHYRIGRDLCKPGVYSRVTGDDHQRPRASRLAVERKRYLRAAVGHRLPRGRKRVRRRSHPPLHAVRYALDDSSVDTEAHLRKEVARAGSPEIDAPAYSFDGQTDGLRRLLQQPHFPCPEVNGP